MENTQSQEILEVHLDEMHKLERNEHYVLVSANTGHDLDSVLVTPEFHKNVITFDTDYHYPKRKSQLLIGPSDKANTDNYKKIVIHLDDATVSGIVETGMLKNESNYYRPKYREFEVSYYLELRNETTVVRFKIDIDSWTTPREMKLYKENGEFFFDFRGVKFPTTNYFKPLSGLKDEYDILTLFINETPNSDKNWDLKKEFIKANTKYTAYNGTVDVKKTQGISKTFNTVHPFYEKIKGENVLADIAFKTFAELSKRTVDSVKMSVVFNKIFANVNTQEAFEEKLDVLVDALNMQNYYDYATNFAKATFELLDDAREIKKASLKKRATGAFNKMMADLDFVDIDESLYPITKSAVFSGDIPLGTFFRKSGETYFMYNDNWELWEEMLTKHRDVAIEIAKAASGRTTYEKDIMSYFYFMLRGLPKYLEKHTGRKWTTSPKLVESSTELEPPKEGDNGITKSRSALTPIVDNENSHVVVPYVSMKVYGQVTQYVYALDFNILSEGMSFRGNAVNNEIEEKLNGHDDYGLMFYTLTGSDTARGYPTFLIIFERLEEGETRVHFHRTHPMRSKDGDYNPIHNWIKGCYKWMVGNVPFGHIVAQQGDLAFVLVEKDLKLNGTLETVNSYDSHAFERPVKFVPPAPSNKTNTLGHIIVDGDIWLRHPEHKDRVIPAGTYEIRQCRSWEANPRGIWSLRID